MIEFKSKKGLLIHCVSTLLVGLGALFLFSPSCSVEDPVVTSAGSSRTPEKPDKPDKPDQSDPVKVECTFPDYIEKCKQDKGTSYTCRPDGRCVECKPGMTGCPCVGSSKDLSERYCLEGQGDCKAAAASPHYTEPFCSWCLPGSEYCPCADAGSPCAPGLSCVAISPTERTCLKEDCSEAGAGEGTNCRCPGGGICDVTDDVCWGDLCRSCPGSQEGCPCNELRGCAGEDGLFCLSTTGEEDIKRCARASSCGQLQCDSRQLCCDSSNLALDICGNVPFRDQVKCLSECMPGFVSADGGLCNECAKGYYGVNCNLKCPGGVETPCNNNGECKNSGVCECDNGFAGASCEKCASGYWGAQCRACPGGGASPCGGNGVCSDGKQGTGQCACSLNTGWSGYDCSGCPHDFDTSGGSCVPMGVTCLPGCGQNGKCAGTNLCSCNTGWEGDTCKTCARGYVGPFCAECPGGAGSPCSGNASCEPYGSSGAKCECQNWTGTACETCPEGYDTTGGKCTPPGVSCTPNCGANGHCTANNTCTCNAGFTGATCDDCKDGYFGYDCRPCPGGYDSPCNGHGTCDDGRKRGGRCTCSADWVGVACDVNANCGKGQQLRYEECVDVDECATNNGGCGDPARVQCENAASTGDPAVCTCKDSASGHYDKLLTCQHASRLECQRYNSFVCRNSDENVVSGYCSVLGAACGSGTAGGTCAPRVIQDAVCNAFGDTCASASNAAYKGQCVKAVTWGETCLSEGASCAGGTCQKEALDCSGCVSGHYGDKCLQVCPGGSTNPCSGNGVCSGATDPVCTCSAGTGWAGSNGDCSQCEKGWDNTNGKCNTDINECTTPSAPCKNNATCAQKGIGDYSCSCTRDNKGVPAFTGKNCEIEASDNPGQVVLAGSFYEASAGAYSVSGAKAGASNGCNYSSAGVDTVYVHEAQNSNHCSNSCCEVIECNGWKDCEAIPGTYCTQAYKGADESYCLPRHPGLREEAKTTANSDKLLAIRLNGILQANPLFVLRNVSNRRVFEWQRLGQSSIRDQTRKGSTLRCSDNSIGNNGVPANMTCRKNGSLVAGTQGQCSGKRLQAECCAGANCGKCLGNPLNGLTGVLWPVTTSSGVPICETKEDYSLNPTFNGALLCDEDADGWVRDTAYNAYKHPDMGVRANAKCNLSFIREWVLVNEYQQKLIEAPKDLSGGGGNTSSYVPAWVCPDKEKPCLPRIETGFLDGDNTADTSGVSGKESDRKAYRLTGSADGSGITYSAADMNPMVKACTSNLANGASDYNKNGVEDWEENQNSGWAATAFKTVYDELQRFTFFEELYTADFSAGSGKYRIQERPRCDLGSDWPTKIPLGYNDLDGKSDEESAQWQSCMRAPGPIPGVLGSVAERKVAVNAERLIKPGYDFSRYYWGKKTGALSNNSNDQNFENRAQYEEPVVAAAGTANKSDVEPVSVKKDLPYAKEGTLGFNGGWCAVQSGNEHVGAYGGPTQWGSDTAAVQVLKAKLEAVKGQEFEVDASGRMAPKGCTNCAWRGMNLYSQFQCVQVQDTGAGWTYNKLASDSSVAADDAYEYVLNECTKDSTCSETHRGDCVKCRRLKVNKTGAAASCTGSLGCAGKDQNSNKVGFVAIRYKFEERKKNDNKCGYDDTAVKDKYFCPDSVGADTKIGQRQDIPRDLRGCVAEEMFEDKLCPLTGDFSKGIDPNDASDPKRKPRIRGLSLSPYGKVSCYKEPICGDGFKDPGERCDYDVDSSCISSGEGACLCQRNECPNGSTKTQEVKCDDSVSGLDDPCLDVTCTKSLLNTLEGEGSMTGKYNQTKRVTCEAGYAGGDNWKCGANKKFSGGNKCTQCPAGYAAGAGQTECTPCDTPVTTPPGSATCSDGCSVQLLDSSSIQIKQGQSSCSSSDLELGLGENCNLTCKDGYFFNSKKSDGTPLADQITLTCAQKGTSFGVKCLPRVRNIENYIYDTPSQEKLLTSSSAKDGLLMWVDASHPLNYDADPKDVVRKVFDLSGKGNDLSQGGGTTKVTAWSKGKKVEDVTKASYDKVEKKGLRFNKSSLLAESTGDLKTLFVVFQPGVSMNHYGDSSFQGLLSFKGDSTDSPHGIHFGEYKHKGKRSETELITVVGEPGEAAEWKSNNEGALLNTDTYLLVLREISERIHIQLLGGSNVKCEQCDSVGSSTQTTMAKVEFKNLGLGYAFQHPKSVKWKAPDAINDININESTNYDYFDAVGWGQGYHVGQKLAGLVDDMTDPQQKALFSTTIDFYLYCSENDGEDNVYDKRYSKSIRVKTASDLKVQLKDTAQSVWTAFKTYVEEEEGGIDILRLRTTVTFPEVDLILPENYYAKSSGKKSFNGDIGELLMFDRSLKDSDHKEIIKYLSEKWGVTLSHN